MLWGGVGGGDGGECQIGTFGSIFGPGVYRDGRSSWGVGSPYKEDGATVWACLHLAEKCLVVGRRHEAVALKFWNLSPSVVSKRHNAFHQEAKSGKQCFRCLHSVRDRAGTAPGPRRERRGERKRKEERREEKRREEERRGANPPKNLLIGVWPILSVHIK